MSQRQTAPPLGLVAGRALVAAIACILALAACGSDDNSDSSSGSGSSSSATPSGDSSSSGSGGGSGGGIDCGNAKGTINASGSSAQKNAMDEWVKAFQQACQGVTINYDPSGSSNGREAFFTKTADFAGSDSAIKDEDRAKADGRCAPGKAVDLPMVMGPIAIAYNLQGVDDLVLDAKTLAGIFTGKITKWDAEEIKALNKDAQLPSVPIAAVHRSDGSGTSDNFTKYLAKNAPDVFTAKPGSDWPLPNVGQGAAKSAGVTQAVKSTQGGVTYVEQSFAENASLGVAKIDNGSGTPVELTTENATKALGEAKVAGQGNDLKLDLAYDTKTEGAYPIILVTYEIVCEKGLPAEKADTIKSFLTYTASEEGQGLLEGAGYAPLPDNIVEKVRTVVSGISAS